MALVHINSKFRNSGTFGDFRIEIDFPRGNNFCTVSLVDVVLPNGWYNISAQNNKIVFNEGGLDLTATLPVGFYTASTLPSALASALNAASTLPLIYSCTFTELTGLITISASGNFILKFSKQLSPAYRLGFTKTDTINASTHTGTFLMNLAPDSFVYLSIEGFSECLTAQTHPVQVSFPISLYNNTGTISKFENTLTYKVNKSFFSKRNTRIRLFDENGQDLPLLTDWGFTLDIKNCACSK